MSHFGMQHKEPEGKKFKHVYRREDVTAAWAILYDKRWKTTAGREIPGLSSLPRVSKQTNTRYISLKIHL